MPPALFSDAANPNPDPVQRLGQQALVCMSQLELARTIKDLKVEAEAEWRLNVILDALSDIYKMRRARAALTSAGQTYIVGEAGPELIVPG